MTSVSLLSRSSAIKTSTLSGRLPSVQHFQATKSANLHSARNGFAQLHTWGVLGTILSCGGGRGATCHTCWPLYGINVNTPGCAALETCPPRKGKEIFLSVPTPILCDVDLVLSPYSSVVSRVGCCHTSLWCVKPIDIYLLHSLLDKALLATFLLACVS